MTNNRDKGRKGFIPAEGRVVMITGASRGIGAAIATYLFDEGYSLSLGMRTPALARLESRITSSDRVHCFEYECRRTEDASRWVDAVVERFGRIDALVNNAGITRNVTIEDGDIEQLDELWEVNAKAPFILTRAAFPHLKASGAGRVVSIISLSGKRVAGARTTGYSMSKFAAMALSHGIRFSGWEHGVRSTAISPGWVATDMSAPLTDLPSAEMIQPETIAALCATAIALPNPSSVVEIPINCILDHGM